MSPRTWAERVQDILEAIGQVQAFTHGMDFVNFQNDAKTVKAVGLNFIIMGEAATHIPESVRA